MTARPVNVWKFTCDYCSKSETTQTVGIVPALPDGWLEINARVHECEECRVINGHPNKNPDGLGRGQDGEK